jgi:hypothetical protein
MTGLAFEPPDTDCDGKEVEDLVALVAEQLAARPAA